MIDSALVERFENPPPEYGPTPLWWWSGGTVTEEGILWQLQTFADGGILNLVLMNLAPKGPTYGAMPDDPVWFSERWWELFRYTCDRAAELGISLWFYDQIGFSGANIQGQITASHPEAAGRALSTRVVECDTEGRIEELPREHVIGVYSESEDPNKGWQLHEVIDGRVAGASSGRRLRVVGWRETSFDYLDTESVALLVDYIHGEYERRVPDHLGTTIVGSFQDELPAMPTWSSTFADRFLEETGYDLLPVLPALWDQGSERSAQIRADYHRVRTLLAEQAFFRPLGEWHRSRGMLIGADQTNPARAGVPTQSLQLYGDYFATHRWFDAVGSDHEGDARIHSSMADLYDHPRVWIESFHSSGWGGTLEETWDWLIPFFRSGANLYNPHASYYGLQAGWFEWAPPSTDFRQPYYEVYPAFAKAVSRVCALLTWGRHAADVALLYPATSISAELPPDLPVDHFLNGDIGPEYTGVDAAQRSYMTLAGKNDWFRAAPSLLERAGIDFDVIDDDSLVRAEARGGAVHVNDFGFRTVILPEMDRIAPVVALRLAELLDAGGRVIAIGSAPTRSAGSTPAIGGAESDESVRRFAEHPGLHVVADAEAVIDALADVPRFASAPQGVRAQRLGDLGLALVPGAFPNATAFPLRGGTGQTGWDDIDFDADRYSKSQELDVAGAVIDAELWNPATGARTPAPFEVHGERSTITLDGGGAPLLIAVWQTADAAAGAPAHVEPSDSLHSESINAAQRVDGAIDWTQELLPTLDNRWGDFALPPGDQPIPLGIWKLDLVADGERTPVRVTFGQEVLISEPFSTEGAPAPIDSENARRMKEGALLGDNRWSVQRYSATHGRDGSTGEPQDPKGFIGEEFLVHATPHQGEEVRLRTLVRVDESGDYELTVATACPVRAWLDGEPLVFTSIGYHSTASVRFTEPVAVLEIGFGAPIHLAPSTARRPDRMTASFTVSRPGQHVRPPEFMAAGDGGVEAGTATFRRPFRLEAAARAVKIVTGAPCALTVFIDGRAVARQEKVEYYESGLGDNPMYFTHDIGALPPGDHTLQVVTDGVRADTPLFVDLVAECADGLVAVASGPTWTVGSDDEAVVLAPERTGNTTHARAALRPHPLAAAHWLSGPPEIGEPSVTFSTSASAAPRSETFEATIPAGTVEIDLTADPLQEPESVVIAGRTLTLHGRTVVLDAPTSEPTTMSVTLPERAFSTAGAAWEGPLVVRTVPTPAIFADWSEQGLESWSGGVRYSGVIDVAPGESLRLDLGRVRGAVTVDVDDERMHSAFCAPFTFDLTGLAAGARRVAVTVYSTLGPRYAYATQSRFLVPSQLKTGLGDSIRVIRRADTDER
ncbi:hypothetical protein [Microbacterium sp.]|uniref:hypothetical protein n=1 Tax=Microbacterium sp. TaxID=51671 RepID=UPI003563EA8F